MFPCALRFPRYDFVRPRILRGLTRISVAQFFFALAVVCSCGLPALGQFVGYVPNTVSNSVTIFGTQLTTQAAPLGNSNTDNIIQTLGSTTGWNGPVRVAVLGDFFSGDVLQPTSTAYVTSQGDSGLWAIDTLTQLATRSATATNINAGANPLKLNQPGGIAIANAPIAGATVIAAYVANQSDGTVSVVNIDPGSASQNSLIANLSTVSPAASSSTIPEVAAAGEFVFVIENSPSPSLWYINISSATQATQVALPEGTGKLTALNAFQLSDSSANLHTFVAVSDSTNGTVIVIDATSPANPVATVVTLGSGASPVSLISAFDVAVNTTGVQAIYVADNSSGFPIWYFDVDCSSTTCNIPSSVSSPLTNASAAPTSIGITPDGQQLFFTESSGPGIQNFCLATCTNPDNASDTKVGTSPTGIAVTDISTGSAPLCWFTGTGTPPPTATAVPTSVCNSISCNSNGSALGACAESRNVANSANIILNFQDTFGCVPFGTTGNPTSTCSASGGLGGQTLYNVAGVFTTVISQTNSAGTGSISSPTTVSPDVSITTQPSSQTINPGSITLSVVARSANGAVLTYQWFQGVSPTGTAIPNATGFSFTTPNLSASTSYWVQVNDSTGPVNSNTAFITVNTPPTITTQPLSQSVLTGTSATLTVVATGTTPFTYQWYQGASGDTSNPISSATSSTFNTGTLNTVGQFQYWVRVSNSLGQADSTTAIITVTQSPVAPSITTQPASVTIATGQTATLTVIASGTSLSYQWYRGSSGVTTNLIDGATNSSYMTPALVSTTTYWVRVSNSVGQVDSNTATVTVVAPMTATPPASTTVTAGQSLTYTISLNSGTTALNLACQPQPPNQSLPTGVSCLFSPTQISTGQTSQLTVATTGPTASLNRDASPALFYAVMCSTPLFGLWMIFPSPGRLKRPRFLRLICPSLLLLLLIGCGTNPKPVPTPPGAVTPPGVYTMLVVGTTAQNQVVVSTPVTFTVH